MLKEKIKDLVVPVIFLIILGIIVLALSMWKEEEVVEEIIKVNSYEGSEKELVLENDALKFSMDPQTTQFSVTVKDSGKVWYSNPQDADKDSVALNTDKENLQSTLLLTYSTINGVDTLYNNYKYSMEGHTYNIEATDDAIRVNYSIGEVEKEYYVPMALKEARMLELLDKMSTNDANMVKDYYKKYDINKLGAKDDKDELLSKYPELKTDIMYVLRDGVKDNLKIKFQQFFEEAGYTVEEYKEEKEKYAGESESTKPVFNVAMEYRLDGDDLLVSIPMADIQYKKDYPLLNLNILPFFGAGGKSDEGYMLIPEGGGSLIRFNNGKLNQNSYCANMYGWDMAQGRKFVVHETDAYFGTFGIANKDDSFICMLQDGASYASINADISGRNNSYNYVNASYNVTHREQCEVADKYNGEMFVYEDTIAPENLTQRYRFVSSGNYAEMAKAYRGYLEQRFGDEFVKKEDTTMPVSIEVVGAVDKIEQVCGVPVSKPLKVTSYKEAQAMLEDIKASGIDNISVKLSGWMNGGVQQKMLSKAKTVGRLGSSSDLKKLMQYGEDNNIAIYVDGVTNYAIDSKAKDGFLQFRDAARLVSKEKVELNDFNTIWYGIEKEKDPYYLLKPEVIMKMADKLAGAAEKFGAQGVALRDMGSQLSSDFDQKDRTTREAAKNMQQEKLTQIKDGGLKVMTNSGNDYALGATDFITNMDLQGSGYTIIDEEVPFYQMAIHGYVDYSGNPINLAKDYKKEILTAAEYGAALSFTFMEADSTELQNTQYTEYFGANYDGWKEKMNDIYTRYQKDLGDTFALDITGHESLTEQVKATTYSDGTKVYVNYGQQEYSVDGVEVPARDYLVVR